MLLGKRPRPPIRRTTSTTGLTVDLSDVEATNQPSDAHPMQATPLVPGDGPPPVNLNSGYDQQFLAMVSPREYRGSSSDFTETPHFLRSCGLCKRRLTPSRDIYMYRGDTAFCSLECREKQMKQDESKEKKSVVASNSGSEASSTKSQTVAG
ncbi:hypothetical protein SLA2020_179010 [Shorea laevis]